MKAILISDDEAVTSILENFLNVLNFDVIIYRWLLKAMDNTEEIKPDLVIISSSEYPRHWKTFVQFVKGGIAGPEAMVVLYAKDKLSEEDSKKAEILGVKGILTSLDEDGLTELSKIVSSIVQKSKQNEIHLTSEEKKIMISGTDKKFHTANILKETNEEITILPDNFLPEENSKIFITRFIEGRKEFIEGNARFNKNLEIVLKKSK